MTDPQLFYFLVQRILRKPCSYWNDFSLAHRSSQELRCVLVPRSGATYPPRACRGVVLFISLDEIAEICPLYTLDSPISQRSLCAKVLYLKENYAIYLQSVDNYVESVN